MSRRAWAYFWAVSLLWGSSFLFIKVALDEVSPAMVVFARTALGTLFLLPIALATGAFRGLRGRFGALMALAVIDVAAPFLLIAFGEERISSSLAGILVSTDPLFVALLAIPCDPSERVRGGRLAGLAVGIVGVVVLLGLDVSGTAAELAGAAMVLAAALGFAAAALLYKRRFTDAQPLGVVTLTLAISAALVALPALLTNPLALPSGEAAGALLALGLPNTGIGFWLFYALIALAGAGKASVITYVSPAVAVLLGVLLLDEAFTASTAAGLGLILLGSWLATGGRLRSRRGRATWRSRPCASSR